MTLLPESLGFKTHYFDLPGLRMHAATAGPEDGPLLILLHGFPDFWYGWRHHMGPFALAGYRVVAPDQRGYNLTDKTPPYNLATTVADIEQLMQACGREEAYVVGHDWGAFVAWGLAAAAPQKVKRLGILNVPHPGATLRVIQSFNLRQLFRSWYMFYFQIPWLPEVMVGANNFAAMRQAVRASALPNTFGDDVMPAYLTAWGQPGALSAMLGWYRALFQKSLGSPADRQLAQTRVTPPTLILWGDADTALETSLADDSLTWCDHGRIVHFPNNTHWLVEENHAEVTRLLLEHFQ